MFILCHNRSSVANILVFAKEYCYIFTFADSFMAMKASHLCYFGNFMFFYHSAHNDAISDGKKYKHYWKFHWRTFCPDGYMCGGKEILAWKAFAGLLRWLLQHTLLYVCKTADETVCENTGAWQKSTNPAPPHYFFKLLNLVFCHQYIITTLLLRRACNYSKQLRQFPLRLTD